MADEKNSKRGRFSRLFGRSSSSSSAAVAPPPYSGAPVSDSKTTKVQAPTLQAPEEQFPDITALSVPQWTWTNAQCREWLRKFLVSHCGRSVFDASQKAAKLDGFGPNMYLSTFVTWKSLLGAADAQGIYALLLGYRNQGGVLPRGVGVNHPKTAKENLELLAAAGKMLDAQTKK